MTIKIHHISQHHPAVNTDRSFRSPACHLYISPVLQRPSYSWLSDEQCLALLQPRKNTDTIIISIYIQLHQLCSKTKDHDIPQSKENSLSTCKKVISNKSMKAFMQCYINLLLAYAELAKPRTRIFVCRVDCLECLYKWHNNIRIILRYRPAIPGVRHSQGPPFPRSMFTAYSVQNSVSFRA